MSDFEHKEEERLSRHQAAERLIDIAYGSPRVGPLELSAGGRRVTIPVGNELRMEPQLKSRGERVTLELELSWSAAAA